MTTRNGTDRREGERRSTLDQATTRERTILNSLQTVLDAAPDSPMTDGLTLAIRIIHATIELGVESR
jgi:hypothetical protein